MKIWIRQNGLHTSLCCLIATSRIPDYRSILRRAAPRILVLDEALDFVMNGSHHFLPQIPVNGELGLTEREEIIPVLLYCDEMRRICCDDDFHPWGFVHVWKAKKENKKYGDAP
jgi:hypothetical protein